MAANLPRQVAKALAALRDLGKDLGKDAESQHYAELLGRLEALDLGAPGGGLAPAASPPGK